ncbi:Transcription elongation factor Spt5 [uncultured archaeon]|nr:Transcription elongation factor Spt5 [uncultured archaeon]
MESTQPNIYVVRATAGQERVVAELLYREAKSRKTEIEKEGGKVYSVLYTTGLKGYVLVEADGPGTVEDLARGVPKTRGLLLTQKGNLESAGTIGIDELQEMLIPTPVVTEVNRGDLVELVAGPFKGEKARIAKIDKDKNEITVELIEAAVPIPVIIRGDDIRKIKKEETEEERNG